MISYYHTGKVENDSLVTAECVDDLINDVHQAILADGLSNDPTKDQL